MTILQGFRSFEDQPRRRFKRKDLVCMSFLPSRNTGLRSTQNHEIQAIGARSSCSELMRTQTQTQNQISFSLRYQTLENTHMQRSKDKILSLISRSLLSVRRLINIYLRSHFQRRFAISTNSTTMIHSGSRIQLSKMKFSSEI